MKIRVFRGSPKKKRRLCEANPKIRGQKKESRKALFFVVIFISIGFLFLPVIGVRAVFPLIVLFQDVWGHRRIGIEAQGFQAHLGDGLHHYGVVNGGRGVFAPCEGAVVLHQHAGHRRRVQIPLLEAVHDDLSRIFLVGFFDFRLRQLPGAGHRAVEIIGVRRAQRGNVHARLRESDGVDGMGMGNAADGRKGAVQREVRRRVRGRPVAPFHRVPGRKVHDHHIFRLHAAIVHAGGLDDDKIFFPVNPADVAPRVNHDAAPHQFEIRLADLFFQRFQHIASLPAFRDDVGPVGAEIHPDVPLENSAAGVEEVGEPFAARGVFQEVAHLLAEEHTVRDLDGQHVFRFRLVLAVRQPDGLRADGKRDRPRRADGVRHQRRVAIGNDNRVVSLHLQQIRRADEVRDEGGARRKINFVGRALLVQMPFLHDDDGVGHGKRFLLVVGDVNRRQAHVPLDRPKLHPHRLAQLRVQIGKRLVEEQHVRLHDEGARHRHALLLAAGHLVRVAVAHAFELHQFQRVPDPLFDLALVDMADMEAVGDVLIDGHVGEQRVLLKDHRGIALVGRDVRDLPPREGDGAAVRLVKARDHAENRGLAAARGAEQRDEVPLLHLKIHIVNDLAAAEKLVDIFQFHYNFSHRAFLLINRKY